MVDPSRHKASGFSENIDFKKILREAATEMNAEEKYQRENDAKFRAVYQKVATYEEFCDIVLASNLKPLDKTDSVSLAGAGRCTWNVNATDATSKQQQHCEGIQHNSTEPPNSSLAFENTNINSQSEFYRVYRKLSITDKYIFLIQLGGDKLLTLFPTEIDVFDDLMLVLSSEFTTADLTPVLSILQSLANMKRFFLAIQFIDTTTKTSLTSLLKLITQTNSSDETEKVVSIYNKYL